MMIWSIMGWLNQANYYIKDIYLILLKIFKILFSHFTFNLS